MKTRLLLAILLVLAALLSVTAVTAQDDGEITTPRVALTAPTQPSYVSSTYGPVAYGSQFGLEMTLDDFIIFDSHATATQSVLAGEADFVGGSLISHFLLNAAGQDFRVFCPMVSQDDFVLVGRNGVTEPEQLMDPDTRVAIDSPGGAGDMILNALMQATGMEGNVSDLPNTTVLESSGLRTNAWAADQVDATIIHLPQYQSALAEAPDGVIITSLYENVPVYVKNTFAAPGDWLDENLETAAAFCASFLAASRELESDFDLYLEAVEAQVSEPPEEETLAEVWGLISEYDFWNSADGLDPDALIFMAELAVQSGILEEVPNIEDVYDPRPTELALEMLGASMAVDTPRVAMTAPTQPSYVNSIYGPVDAGAEFGLEMTPDDFIIFDSHATATQSVLAGEADFVGGSLISHLLLNAAGQDFRIFCPMVSQDDFVLVGRNGVTEVEQLMDPDTRVAVDSPGGAGEMILNALLQASGMDVSVSDLPNTTVLESSGLRTNAWAADQVDATIIHLPQFQQALAEAPDGVIITSLYENVPVYVKEAFAAPGAWLDENPDVAAAFCASVIQGSRELAGDFDMYVAAVNNYVGEPPSEEALAEVWGLISEYDFWNSENGLDPEAITFMAELAVMSGILDEVPDINAVYDPGPTQAALEMLGG